MMALWSPTPFTGSPKMGRPHARRPLYGLPRGSTPSLAGRFWEFAGGDRRENPLRHESVLPAVAARRACPKDGGKVCPWARFESRSSKAKNYDAERRAVEIRVRAERKGWRVAAGNGKGDTAAGRMVFSMVSDGSWV